MTTIYLTRAYLLRVPMGLYRKEKPERRLKRLFHHSILETPKQRFRTIALSVSTDWAAYLIEEKVTAGRKYDQILLQVTSAYTRYLMKSNSTLLFRILETKRKNPQNVAIPRDARPGIFVLKAFFLIVNLTF